MRRRRTLSLAAWLLVLFAFTVLSPRASLQQRSAGATSAKGGAGDITGEYEIPDPNWPQWSHPYPKPGYIWGSQGGVFAESPNRIYLANRGELKLPDKVPNNFPGNWGFFNQMAATQPIANMVNCIVVVDGNGKLIEAWNQWDKLFEWGRGPHQVYISPYDPERHVWVVDDMRHVIYRFTHDGKQLVQTLGVLDEFGENDDLTRFRRPTMGPGQFNTPHGIAVGGSPPRVFVSDRGNRRIQVFDVNGKFLEEWPGIAPHSMLMSADEHVWAVDSLTDRIVKFDLSGHVEFSFGQFGTRPGYTWAMHQISADSDSNLYLAEVFGGRTQKYRPKPGADPTKLVWGRALMPMTNARTN